MNNEKRGFNEAKTDVAACKESQVLRALSDLEHRIGMLRDVLKSIKTRMEPVLRSELLMVEKNAKPISSEAHVPLAGNIQNHISQIERLTEDMRDVLARLEL